MFTNPEDRMLRRPVISMLKRAGGVDPNSTLAGELRHMGLSPRKAPGLFRHGGRGAIDNIPKCEAELFADKPCDGNGYVPEGTILEALRDELFGQPWRSADELEEIETWKLEAEAAADPYGLVYASEQMAIDDESAIAEAQAIMERDEASDPFEALERAVIGLGERARPAKRKRKAVKTMTPDEFRTARKKLGLSVKQMSLMLGVVADGTQVRRMEMQPGKGAHRPISGTTARLVRAYLDGYRPKDWLGK